MRLNVLTEAVRRVRAEVTELDAGPRDGIEALQLRHILVHLDAIQIHIDELEEKDLQEQIKWERSMGDDL